MDHLINFKDKLSVFVLKGKVIWKDILGPFFKINIYENFMNI